MPFRYDNLRRHDALAECHANPHDVYVGFIGGVDSLRSKGSVYALARRWWKVRNVRTNVGKLELIGPPVDGNWIEGNSFRGVMAPWVALGDGHA